MTSPQPCALRAAHSKSFCCCRAQRPRKDFWADVKTKLCCLHCLCVKLLHQSVLAWLLRESRRKQRRTIRQRFISMMLLFFVVFYVILSSFWVQNVMKQPEFQQQKHKTHMWETLFDRCHWEREMQVRLLPVNAQVSMLQPPCSASTDKMFIVVHVKSSNRQKDEWWWLLMR